ncbi:MAG: ATP-binding protein [Candidatus Lokiarchaeota archaeon]|nr:ATP-binding protein [Candidatus Lokiarchaeota archaeon]
MDKSKKKKLDQKIINSITPFSRLSYNKAKKVDIFVGRDKSLRYLTESLFKSVFNDQSFGITISGPGGCGKSTLFGYFMQLINSQKIFQEKYCYLNKDDSKIISCFIDAPKGEPTTLKYFWTSIIDALAEENRDFLEEYSTVFIRKCISILWNNKVHRDEIISIFLDLIPNIEVLLSNSRFVEIVNIDNLFNFLISKNGILDDIYKIIKFGWRILQKNEVTFGLLGKSGDFNQKRSFKYDKRYIDLLFNVLSSDPDKSASAQNILKGVEGDLLKSDSDVISLFNWLTQTWEWMEEKPVSFLVGIDNIGYLTQNIKDKSSAFPPFIQTILQMRNKLKKCLFVLIATNDDWRQFNTYTSQHEDYRTQLQGFLINRLDLTRLVLSEVQEALTMIMNNFWSGLGILDPSNSVYPFSELFFSYLYEYHAHEYRAILNHLNQIWGYYKTKLKVLPLTNPFKMINFVRVKTYDLFRQTSQEAKNKLSELFFSNLIEWEKKQIKNQFNTIQARHLGKKQSDIVEKKVTEALRVLQENENPKQIEWVEQTPPINVETEKGKRTRYPDVYVKLARNSISDKKHTFEIQVKMYDKNGHVKLKEIDSSIELLERAYTDALLFLIIGAGLEEAAIEEINRLNLEDRVLNFKPLDSEQEEALSFLVFYEDITGKKISVDIVKEILEILFKEPWNRIINKIRNIGSYRAAMIEEKIKEKEKHTIIGYAKIQGTHPGSETQSISINPPKIEENTIKTEIDINSNTGNLLKPKKVEINNGEQEQQGDKSDFDQILKDLQLSDSKILLTNVHHRYKDSKADLEFIINTAIKRTDRYKGKVTKAYLKKKVPAHLSDENINELFLRLKNEYSKNQIPQEECLFLYEGTSLVLTDIGKKYSSIINKIN